jgi:hypothetical protein
MRKWRSVHTVENCPYSSVPTTEKSLSVKRSLSTSMVLAAHGALYYMKEIIRCIANTHLF